MVIWVSLLNADEVATAPTQVVISLTTPTIVSVSLFSVSCAGHQSTGRSAAGSSKIPIYIDGIKLQYLHDKILTDRMKSLAQSADIFIVNTWDAKHAATNGIKNNRPENTVTLEPEGKSASSLLRCLTQYLSLITSR